MSPRVMRPVSTSLEFASSLTNALPDYTASIRQSPDHEIGDICMFFLACRSVMSPEQRALALSDP